MEENLNRQFSTESEGETKLCRHCQMEIPVKAKICPHCRKKQKKGIIKWIILGIVACLVLAITMSSIKDAKIKNAANEIGRAAVASNELFSTYDVNSEAGGYRITVYVNEAYGNNMYMTYLLKGVSEEDIMMVSNVYKWEYYNNGLTTYEGFYSSLITNTYTELYEDVLDTYTDYMNDYMDQMENLFN